MIVKSGQIFQTHENKNNVQIEADETDKSDINPKLKVSVSNVQLWKQQMKNKGL